MEHKLDPLSMALYNVGVPAPPCSCPRVGLLAGQHEDLVEMNEEGTVATDHRMLACAEAIAPSGVAFLTLASTYLVALLGSGR